MAFTPGSVVHFLNVPLENNYKNQIYFADRSAQTTFMMTKRKHTFNDLTYVRKDNIIRVPVHIDDLYDCNYVMYKNSKYNDRWFYAFITDMTYINDGRTDVTIETDCWQTWFDKITIKDSFVEREHVEDDTVGKHIVGENLQLGDYVCDFHTQAGYDDGELSIVVGVTETPDGGKVHGTLYNNIYSGLKYFVFPNNMDGASALENWLADFDKDAIGEAVQCMFLAPKKLVPQRSDRIVAGGNGVGTF